MEQFTLLAGDQTLKDSREQINNALLSVRSLSSGTAFPTTELSEGMLCYRTDLARLYQLIDLASQTWSDKISVSISGTASSADAAPWDGITDKPAAYPAEEHTHNYAGASTAGGAATSADKLTTARTINGVAFDGTGDIEIDVGVKTVNSTAPDEDGNLILSGVPIGSVIAFAANSAPSGYLLCNGAAVSRTTYAELFAIIGTTYGTGDGSTTFALPNLTDKFIQGSTTAGTVKSAGLPNITGTFNTYTWSTTASGAFTGTANDGNSNASGTGKYVKFTFSAKNSNSIYGASTTVQPPAVTMRYYIKY